jgi:hypothetical protein
MQVLRWVKTDISKYYILIFRDNTFKIIQETSMEGVVKLEWRTGNFIEPVVIYSFDQKPSVEEFEKITGIKPYGPLAIIGNSRYEWVSTPVDETPKKIEPFTVYESK